MADDTVFEGWAILELMGHRRLAGYVREVELAGHGMLRLDVPQAAEPDEVLLDGPPLTDDIVATQFYAASALYCLTPTTEATARAVAARARPAPAQRWELEPAREPALVDDDDNDDDVGF